jgi:Na+/melibiose symporter-like transporter
MNKTQKGAWFTLGVAILLLVFLAIIYAGMLAPGGRTAGIGLVIIWSGFILVFLAGGAAFVHWKRKPSNVDFDERDNSVRKNAVLAAFVGLWVLLFAASIIPSFVAGDAGSIQVCLLPIINICVFVVVMLIYSVAVLVQYGSGGKGDKS